MRAGFLVAATLVASNLGSRADTHADPPSGSAIVIHVDTAQGRDGPGGTGLLSAPVATLDRALELVAAVRAKRPGAEIAVDLAPGTYRVAHAVTIASQHGGTAAAPLVIRGSAGGGTRLSGSVLVEPLSEPLPAALIDRLPPEARDHVRLYRLPTQALDSSTIQNISLLRNRPATVALEVYDREGALVPARWPKEGWAQVVTGSSSVTSPGFTVEGGRLERWRNEPDLWAEGFWRWDWLFESLPVSGIHVASRRIDLPQLPYEGILPRARYRISHALSELDQPGTWWRDVTRGLLVAWPRDKDERLDIAVAATLLDIEGASHVRLEDLTLEHARGDLAVVNGGRDVVIRKSVFGWAARRGAVFQASRDSGLDDCDLTGQGDTAVRLDGGDRASLTPGGLFVRNSRFTRFARLSLTQRPAIELDGVGATVEGNLFHDAGAPALIIHGNDHRIVGNELTHLLSGIADEGAIYAGRDWTARGTVIEGNYLHDIRADPGFEDKGIYLDDFESGFVVRGNLFVRVDQPVFLGGGRDNVVADNVFVDASPAIHVDSRGETWAASAVKDPESELMAAYRAMPTGSPLWRRRYPGLFGIPGDEPAVGKNNRLVGNTFLSSTPFDFSDGGHRSRQVIEGNIGPEGLRSASGASLSALVAGTPDPGAFADLVGPDGRPAGLDLGRLRRAR